MAAALAYFASRAEGGAQIGYLGAPSARVRQTLTERVNPFGAPPEEDAITSGRHARGF
jgi:hypothetical protein